MKYTKPLNETNEDAGYVNADVSIGVRRQPRRRNRRYNLALRRFDGFGGNG